MQSPPVVSSPREETGIFRTADGTRLAWTRRRTGARRLIVVSPGVLMDRGGPEHRLLAERLCGIADVLTLDARGHGDSGGTFTYGVREPEDLAALARSLRPEYDRLGGLGFSYGGFHTIVAAAREAVFDAVAVVGTPHRLFIFDHNFLTAGLARSLPLLLRLGDQQLPRSRGDPGRLQAGAHHEQRRDEDHDRIAEAGDRLLPVHDLVK